MNKNDYNETNKIIIDINNIESFLIKSGYISQNIWTKNNYDLFEYSKANEVLLGFEFNEKISVTEASVKYGDKIQWINKIFKSELNLEDLHTQYIHYTSTNISFARFLNNFIMLETTLKNFYNIINKNNENNINNIFNQQIIMNDIDIYSSLKDKNILGLKQKLDLIYSKINRSPVYNGKDANYKLITIIFLLSFGSSFSVDKNIPQISNLMNLFTLYNKIYINDIHISFILFLSVIICINLCIYVNKKKSHFKFLNFDNNNYNNFYYQEFKKKIIGDKNSKINEHNDDKQNYISLFLFDNDILSYNGNKFFELLIFQNCLKIYSIYHLSKNQIKLTINLTVDTIIETLKTFSNNIIINNNGNDGNNNNIDINTDNLFNKDSNCSINMSNLLLFSKNNLNKSFSTINFNELLIKVTNFQNENQIKAINSKYFDLIQKTKKLYFQNSIFTLNQINNQNKNKNEIDNKIESNSLDNLNIEFDALNYLLAYYNKTKEVKKYLEFYCFKFKFLKCSVFREGQKEIQIFFDYSSLKEKVLLKYLKDISNLLSLTKQYEKIFHTLNEFKSYKILFRVNQTNFSSRHINFYFIMIVKKLIFFIEENKYYRINLYDSKLKSYEEKMLVYIKDNSIKNKLRMNFIKAMINDSFFNNKLKVFNEFLKELSEDWDIIIIGDDIKNNNLIYSHDTNILFINIIKEANDNSVQTFMAASSIISMSVNPTGIPNAQLNQDNNNKQNYEYLNILMYIKKNEELADKIFKFCQNLKNNINCSLENKITLICERYFFEEKLVMNSRIKEGSKQIYNNIDSYFLICDKKKDNDAFKYDLYIKKNIISLVNNLSQEKTNDFSKFLYNFISTLSSCIELIMYVIKNKEIDPIKFLYIQKIKKEYYIFEYKQGNIFIKQLKVFESLFLLNPKKSIPIFCLLSEKPNNDEDNIENFQELFLRLFLNLNKVCEANKLNETFFEKIHKNMFLENYDTLKIMIFSYGSFCAFNELFVSNNYLEISKNNKFEICYIMPYETDVTQKNENFKKIIEYQKKGKLMVKNLKIYDYNLTNSFIFKNANELKMNFQKVEFIIKYQENLNEIQTSVKDKLMHIYKILKNKKIEKMAMKKIINNIKELYYEKNCISIYNRNISDIEKLLMEFNTEQVKIKAVKLDHRNLYI